MADTVVFDPLLRGTDEEQLRLAVLEDKGTVIASKFLLELDERELKLLMLESIDAGTLLVELDGRLEVPEELEGDEILEETALRLIEVGSDSRELLLLEYVEISGPLPLGLVREELKLMLPEDDEVLVAGVRELDEEDLGLLIWDEDDEVVLGGTVELGDELSLLLGDEYELEEGLDLLLPIVEQEDDELVFGRAAVINEELSLLLEDKEVVDEGPELLLAICDEEDGLLLAWMLEFNEDELDEKPRLLPI